MVRIADIDPDSLVTVSAADLASARPVAPNVQTYDTFIPPAFPAAPTAKLPNYDNSIISADSVSLSALQAAPAVPSAPAAPDQVSLRDLHAAAPLSIDQELDIEGRKYHGHLVSPLTVMPDEQAKALAPDVGLYLHQFANAPDADQAFGAQGTRGIPISPAEKQQLLQQLQKANAAYDLARVQSDLQAGRSSPEADALLANQAAAEAQTETAGEVAGSQFAHGMSNVVGRMVVDPALQVANLETPDQQRARLAADRALQAAQAQRYPITAAAARGVGSVVAPESLVGMALSGGLSAPLEPATALGRAAVTAGEGAAYGGAVMPVQRAAEGQPVSPGDVARDIAVGAGGAIAGRAAGRLVNAATANAPPVVQALGNFAGGAATSGAVNVGAGAGISAAEGRDYTAADAVRDFISGAALHVPGGIPEAFGTLQAARDRLRAADPNNSLLPRMDAEIARHAIEEAPRADQETPNAGGEAGGRGGPGPEAGDAARTGGEQQGVVAGEAPGAVDRGAPGVLPPAETPAAPETAAAEGEAQGPLKAGAREPLSIERRGGLTPDQTRVQDELIDRVNSPEADAIYDQIPDSFGGKVIGTDIARFMHPAYHTVEGRREFTAATSRAASVYASDRLRRAIENPPAKPEGERPLLMFTAGGVASGKSSAIGPETVERADLISDGQMKDPARAIQEINLALQHGWDVDVRYVHRPFPLVVEGAIHRGVTSGRWGPLAELPDLHMQAQASFDEVARHFAGNPHVDSKIVVNEGSPGNPVPPRMVPRSDLAKTGVLRYNDKRALERSLYEKYSQARQSGKYPDELLDQLGRGIRNPGENDSAGTAAPQEAQPGPGPGDLEHAGQGQQGLSQEAPDGSEAPRQEEEPRALGGLPAREERSPGQPAAGQAGDVAAPPGGDERRARSIAGIREALKPFRGVTLHDDGQNLHLVMPNRSRVPWHLVDRLEPTESREIDGYLQSARAANDGKSEFTANDGRKLTLPAGEPQWNALPQADREAILDKFRARGKYDRDTRTITTTHDVGARPDIGSEEIFHAQAHGLKESDLATYRRMIDRYDNEDIAFHAFMRSRGSRAKYFKRMREGTVYLPPAMDRYLTPRERDAGRLLNAAQNDGVLMSDAEFENFRNDMGGLHPDVLKDYEVKGPSGKVLLDKDGNPRLTREGKLLAEFVDEDGYSNATADMDPRQIERYQDRVIRELLMTKEQKIQAAAEHYLDPSAPPELRRAAERVLGRKAEPPPGEDPIPFSVRKRDEEGGDQLTLAGEIQGRATVGRTGSLFDGSDERRAAAPVVREHALPDDAAKFGVDARDLRVASAFSEGEPSAAFAYGVKRALEGKKVGAVKGMKSAEAKEALAGARAAVEGMSPAQRDFAKAQPTAAPDRDQAAMFAVRKEGEEEGKPAPNIVRSAAILAATKTLHAVDPELFDAPPHGNEVPLKVSAADMQAAIDQVGKDWALEPAALEKYRVPVDQLARKLLSIARRQGSFDAALEYLQDPPVRDTGVKSRIRAATESRDPEKVILSARDAIRQAMRQREQGRTEGLREAVALRQRFIDEASKYLTPEERGPLMRDLASIGNEADLYARLQKIYKAFGEAQKRQAVNDVRDLIRGADTKHLRPEFRQAMEALTGNLDDTRMTDRTRARAESLANHVQTLSDEERAALPPKTQALLERLGKEPLASFSIDELHDLGDSIRAIVTQNQLKNRLIVGKHLREVAKVEKAVVDEVMKNNKPLGVVGEEGGRRELGDKNFAGKLLEFTDSPEVLAVSAGGAGGELHSHLYEQLRQAENGHIGMLRRYRGEVQNLLVKHHLSPEQIIAWRDKTRRVDLSALPARPTKPQKGGMEALDSAEEAANQRADMLETFGADADEVARERAAAAAAQSVAAPVSGEPRSIEITGPEALSLWLYDQNPDAREKLLANPVNLERFAGQSALNRTLQPADIRAIEDTLTPFEKDLGQLILKQNQEMGDEISRIHVLLKGYELKREENYFPLLTDQKQKRRVLDELATQYADKWLEQSGFLKERVLHNVPILISDALDTHLWHLRQSVSFVNKAIPVRNARVLLGAPKVREAIDGHVGRTWTPRMERLLKDFSGSELGPRTEAEQLASRIARNAAAATLGLRPTTVATNFIGAPLGLMTQMDAREAKTLAKKWINLKANTVDGEKYFAERIAPNNPYLADRYDPAAAVHRVAVVAGEEAGAGAGGVAPGIPGARTAGAQRWRDFQEWSLSWMNKAERSAVVAAHRAIAELNPEWTDAQVSERVEKMIRRTQNAISSLDMSEFLRQTKRQPFMGLAFMFTNQAAKLRDTLRLAALAYSRSARTPADRARLGATAGLVFTSAAIMPAIVRGLWGQVRQGFREQEDAKAKSAGQLLAGGVADLADVVHPVFGDVVRVLSNPDNANDTVNSRAIAQIAQGLQGAYSEVSKLGEPEQKRQRQVLPAIYRVIANLSRGIATFAGVPLDAPLTAAEGIGRAVAGRPAEFHLEQELHALQKRTSPGALDPRERYGDLAPDEIRRYRVLQRYSDQIDRIRQQEAAGRIDHDRAEESIEQLLAAAGRFPATLSGR